MKRVILLAIFFFIPFLSGCRVGLELGVEIRLGYVTFQSMQEEVAGTFVLDGREMGYLPPLGMMRCLVVLDVPHEARVLSASCPEGVCVFHLSPPLRAGEVIPLYLSGN
ncbi:MAG: hypothetical protein ACUVTO_01785 [Candidatus Caldatribacteriaceae bacterium]